jgi:uncharacterized protein (DUF885 family)
MKHSVQTILSAGLLCVSLSACQLIQQPQIAPEIVEPQFTIQEKQLNEQAARKLFAQFSLWELDSSPMLQAYRGLKSNYGLWDDISEESQLQENQKNNEFLTEALSIQSEALEPSLALSLKVLTYQLKQNQQHYNYRYHNYPINQLFGLHSEIAQFLVNIHKVDTISDAKDYIQRVTNISTLINQLIEQLKIREEKGIRPPKFVYDSVIQASQQLLSGYPLNKTDKQQHILWADFLSKIAPLELYSTSEKVLRDKLKRSLKRSFKPAYQKLIAHLKKSQLKASSETGFHQFESGNEFYELRLREVTTTDINAQQIHQLGLSEIAAIKLQITKLLPQLGESSIEDLFTKTRQDKSLYFANGQQAIDQTKGYIKRINSNLHKAFKGIPDTAMEVSAVESFRENSSPVAFYQSPSDDGSRPGKYYMNLSKLDEMPAFEFEALAYHETIPGHHLQIIYALTNEKLPEFRRHGHFTAYSEGWGLYAERLAKELGGYQEPWNEYGRLLMELWRANRLVIDTGLHHFGWDLEKALAFRLANTPFSKEDSKNAIQRYLVMPAQATSYKIGQLKFIALRASAEKTLGAKFNLSEFHQFILELGPLPLEILEQQVNNWVDKTNKKS